MSRPCWCRFGQESERPGYGPTLQARHAQARRQHLATTVVRSFRSRHQPDHSRSGDTRLSHRARACAPRPVRAASLMHDHPLEHFQAHGAQQVVQRGRPQSIRCDNGPELTSRHFLAWCLEQRIELIHIQPGKPTQNARVESFNGRLREECLRVSWFENLFDARRKILAWRKEYNEQRPHSSLGYQTPAEFAAASSRGKDAGSARLENAAGVSHFPTATAAVG